MMREHAHRTGLDGWSAWADLVREAAIAVGAQRAVAAAREASLDRAWPAPQTLPDELPRLILPERVSSAADALQTVRELRGVLVESLEPGRSAPAGGRYGSEAAPVSPWCDVCGGRRYWRRLSSDGDVSALPLGQDPAMERRRPYCPRCDGGLVSLGEAPLPIVVSVHDTIVYIDAAVLAVEGAACSALGLTRLPDAAALSERIDHIERILPAVERDEVLADVVTRELISCARSARGVLRDHEPMVRLPGRCPWCSSQSLVMWPERGDTNGHRLADGMAWVAGLVECTYRDCRCDDYGCRCHRRQEVRDGRRPQAAYRHAWTNDRWAWLSRLVGINLFDVALQGDR